MVQHAPYLEVVNDGEDNPADFALHLTRRARGIPLWMSLQANGVEAYTAAVETCLDLAAYAAHQVNASDHLALVGEPSLSVVVFRRVGWTSEMYRNWSALMVLSGEGLVTPTRIGGEPALRLCFVNPATQKDDIDRVLNSLRYEPEVFAIESFQE